MHHGLRLRAQGVFDRLRVPLPVNDHAEAILTERALFSLLAGLAGSLLLPNPFWAVAAVALAASEAVQVSAEFSIPAGVHLEG